MTVITNGRLHTVPGLSVHHGEQLTENKARLADFYVKFAATRLWGLVGTLGKPLAGWLVLAMGSGHGEKARPGVDGEVEGECAPRGAETRIDKSRSAFLK